MILGALVLLVLVAWLTRPGVSAHVRVIQATGAPWPGGEGTITSRHQVRRLRFTDHLLWSSVMYEDRISDGSGPGKDSVDMLRTLGVFGFAWIRD